MTEWQNDALKSIERAMANLGAAKTRDVIEMTKPVVLTIERYGTACPTQWDAKTEDGREIYIRYRWGRLRAAFEVGEWPDIQWESIYREHVGPPGDGYMTTENMMRFTGEVLDWSRVQIREAE